MPYQTAFTGERITNGCGGRFFGHPGGSGILEIDPSRIAPKLLEVVEPASLGIKDMDHRLTIIQADPLGMLGTLYVQGMNARLRPKTPFDVPGDPADLRRRVPFAEDEVIDRRVLNVPKVEKDDILTLDVCDTVDYEIVQGADGSCRRGGLAVVDQMGSLL